MHDSSKRFGEERLGHIILRTQGQHAVDARVASVGRDDQHGDGAEQRISRQFLEKLLSVHHRHVDVGEDDVDPRLLEQVESLLTVPGIETFADLEAVRSSTRRMNFRITGESSTIRMLKAMRASLPRPAGDQHLLGCALAEQHPAGGNLESNRAGCGSSDVLDANQHAGFPEDFSQGEVISFPDVEGLIAVETCAPPSTATSSRDLTAPSL